MAGRIKKDATTALKDLAHYLRRDPGASRNVAAIARYVGELRQTQAAMKTDAKVLVDQTEGLQERICGLETQLESVKSELHKSRSLHAQAKSKAAEAKHEAVVLGEKLEAQFNTDDPPYNLQCMDKFIALFKQLRRRMKKPPQPLAKAKVSATLGPSIDVESMEAIADRVIGHVDQKLVQRLADKKAERSLPDIPVSVCRLSDLVTDYRSEQFETLGIFVVITTLIGFPVSFHDDNTMGEWRDKSDERCGKVIRWMRSWIHTTPEDDAAYHAHKKKIQGRPRVSASAYPTGCGNDRGSCLIG